MSALILAPAIILALLGCLSLLHAKASLNAIAHDIIGGLAKEARWAIHTELLIAFLLTNAGYYFATQCLRGAIPVAIATGFLCLLAAIGSQTRYNQTLTTVKDLSDELRRKLKAAHWYVTLGVFLILVPELAILMIFMFID